METEDKKAIKSKAFAINSLMQNPALAKILFDSWESKTGSTKNSKAKAILKSVYKADNNYNYAINDGKGGPGPVNPFQSMFDPSGNYSHLFNSGDTSYQSAQKPVPQTEVVTGVDSMISATPKFSESRLGIAGKAGVGRLGEKLAGPGGVIPQAGMLVGTIPGEVIWPKVKYTGQLGAYLAESLGRGLKGAGQSFRYLFEPGYERTGLGERQYQIPTLDRTSMWGKSDTLKNPVINAYNQRSDVRKTIAKAFPDQDPFKKGTEANTWLNNWWNQTGRSEMEKGELAPTFSDPDKKYFKYSDDGKVYEKSGEKKHISFDFADKHNIWDQIETVERPISGMPAGYTPEGKVMYDEPIGPKTITDKLVSDPDLGTSENISNMTDEELEELLDSIKDDNSISDFLAPSLEGATLKEKIQAGYDLGLGAETTAAMLWQDKDKLAEMLGMSKESAKLLPEYMLSSQLIDLRNARYDEFRIDEQRNKILDKQNRGLTYEDDLKTHVRGRDKYLGQIEKLLTDTKKSISEMDTSNPYVAQRMENYVNYLTILKGRQNQRYIDFIDMSMRDFRADINQSTNMYNRDLETVNKLITDESALTSEAHTNIKNMLTEMYNNIEAREDRQWKLDSRKIDRAKAQRSVITDGLNQKLLQLKINGYGVESDPVSPSTYDKFKIFFGSEDDEGNFKFDTYNPAEVLNTADVTQQNRGSVLTAFYQQMGRDIYSNASTGNISKSNLEKFKNTIRMNGGMKINVNGTDISINDLSDEQLSSLTEEQTNEVLAKSNNVLMKNKLELNLRKGIEEYLTSSEDKIKEIRAAIEDLSRMESGWGRNWSRDKYIKKNEDLGELAGTLYDYAKATVNLTSEQEKRAASPTELEEFYLSVPSEDLPYYIATDLSDYIMYN